MLEKTILSYIEREAKKHIERYHSYHNSLELEYQRNKKRISPTPAKEVRIPEHWQHDKKHNPFYVYKHRKQISHSITMKLLDGTYKPFEPYVRVIPKKGGGERRISVYQIPDAAVSNYLYHQLLGKNKHRFSSLSYAYRNDRNVHYAIQDISVDLRTYPRVFVSEFDFSDFFGSISHNYLYQQIHKNGFMVTEFELKYIKAFLGINTSGKGIPQGTSISLFLANLVCWELDRSLEAEGLRFARYADDTVIWSNDYAKIGKSLDIMFGFSREAGIEINFNKSDGISLLVKKEIPSEFYKPKEFIEFLGYRLSSDKVSIKGDSVRKIKQQISYLLYRNLIQPLKAQHLRAVTIPSNGKDPHFVTAIMQIRRYLYGSLNERVLSQYLNGTYKRIVFKGIMSFYPLLDDEDQIRELDGWLVSTILHALRLRDKLLFNRGFNMRNQFPFDLTHDDIIERCRKYKVGRKRGLIAIPSFLRIYRAIQKGIVNEGIDATMNPKSNSYDY